MRLKPHLQSCHDIVVKFYKIMSYNDLRKGRCSITNQAYFVTTVLDNRDDAIFKSFYCARLLISHMQTLHENNYLHSMAWVIMPDHVHWLFQLGHRKSLAGVMQLFKGGSAYKINKYQQKSGVLWRDSYYEHALRTETEVKNIARYIVANPLRAGLVKKISDYPHWDAIWL